MAKSSAPRAQSGAPKSLPVVQDTESNLVPHTEIDDVFASYTRERDELLATPFAYNRAIAKTGVAFRILRTGMRVLPKMDDPNVSVEKIIYFIELQDRYTYTDETTGEVEEFEAGEKQLIALDRNDVRDKDQEQVDKMLAVYGPIPNCTLQQYPARKKGHSPSHGIVHVSNWRPLSEMS